MKLKWFACLCALAMLPLLSSGCYTNPAGQSKAGVPFVKDSVVSRYPRNVNQVLEATRTVLAYNGQVTSDDSVTRVVGARINNRNVWVHVEELEPNITEVTVQARTKSGGGDVDLAAEIDKQIALQLVR